LAAGSEGGDNECDVSSQHTQRQPDGDSFRSSAHPNHLGRQDSGKMDLWSDQRDGVYFYRH